MDATYKGYNGTVVLSATGLTIKRGAKGFLLGGGKVRGDKTIPYTSIVAVQYKKPGFTIGYLQLTLRGGSDPKAGVIEATEDENTVTFQRKKVAKRFLELKEIIERKMHESHVASNTQVEDLEKLAQLKEKGIITETEFAFKKKQILGV
jgi:hypothetical protein